MVGATALAEFAWSVENLLNRLLDKTLTRSPAILQTLREAVAVLPQLIEHLDRGVLPVADIPAISARAHALAAGKVRDPAATSASTMIAVLSPFEVAPAPFIEETMLSPEVLFEASPAPALCA